MGNFLSYENQEFGTVICKTKDNINAYSSHNTVDEMVKNYMNGTFTGLRWQCVEFVRRYLIETKGITFDEVDNAYQIFNLETFRDLKNKKLIEINKNYNCHTKIPPKKGSLLVWNKSKDLETGHVAIITNISKFKRNYAIIHIAEQNWINHKCTYYTRKFLIKYINNSFCIDDSNLLGWINL